MGTVFGRSSGLLDLDLQKLLGWQGAHIIADAIFQTGSDLAATYILSWDPTSSIAGTHTLRFNEYYLQQKLFTGKVTLRMGQIAAQNEFDNQAIGFSPQEAAFKTWVNNSLAYNVPTTFQLFALFVGKPGFYVRVDPNKHVFFKVAALSAPHSPFVGDPSGIRFDLRNAPDEASSLGYSNGGEPDAHPGVYEIGQVHNFGHFDALISHKPSHGNDEFFADVGQALWRRKIDGHYTHQEVDFQFNINATPRRLNVNDWETLGGIRLVGLTYRRPADIVALGVINSHFSRDYSQELAQTGQPGRASQTTMEVGYKFVIRRWISIWPDFQYVWKPSGNKRLGDAPVLALRLVFDH